MIFKNANDKIEYNNIILKQKNSFLQSWEWGDFQKKIGNDILRLICLNNKNDLILAITLIKKRLFKNKYYYYLPQIDLGNQDQNQFFLKLKEFLADQNLIFIRFDINKNQKSKIKINRTIDVQPSQTMILDLNFSKDELLKKMHSKTRYNIRLALKKGVKIKEAVFEDFEDFWKLMKETGTRDNFRLHQKEHYKKLLKINIFKLYLAEFDGKIICGGIFSFWGNTVTYLHGASANEFRNLMSPYLLQWHLITLAKEKGYHFYDFYGVGEGALSGVTRFKKGFSGDLVKHAGTFDFVLRGFLYKIYYFLRFLRRKI